MNCAVTEKQSLALMYQAVYTDMFDLGMSQDGSAIRFEWVKNKRILAVTVGVFIKMNLKFTHFVDSFGGLVSYLIISLWLLASKLLLPLAGFNFLGPTNKTGCNLSLPDWSFDPSACFISCCLSFFIAVQWWIYSLSVCPL